MTADLYIPSMAAACAIGMNPSEISKSLFTATRSSLKPRQDLCASSSPVGSLPDEVAALPDLFIAWDCRNNRLLAHLANQMRPEIDALIQSVGAQRIAVVIGTSTSGVAEGSAAINIRNTIGRWPDWFAYRQHETGGGAHFLADYLGIEGPAFVVATACSSSAKVFASARRLIRSGIADAAIVGGADSLCKLTLAGFDALSALDSGNNNPFSKNRNGINIGEGGALFILTKAEAEIRLAGIGESSDAYHVSAPEPDGIGTEAAIQAALADAGLRAEDIGYVNLHGTGTNLNDSMEARAMTRVFGTCPPCSSTKPMTGHTLGAAGAIEAAFIWLSLSGHYNPEGLLPPHLWDGEADTEFPSLNFVRGGDQFADRKPVCLSSSFAFGGNNCSLIFEGKAR